VTFIEGLHNATILALVDALPLKSWPDVTVVQMLGIEVIRAALRAEAGRD